MVSGSEVCLSADHNLFRSKFIQLLLKESITLSGQQGAYASGLYISYAQNTFKRRHMLLPPVMWRSSSGLTLRSSCLAEILNLSYTEWRQSPCKRTFAWAHPDIQRLKKICASMWKVSSEVSADTAFTDWPNNHLISLFSQPSPQDTWTPLLRAVSWTALRCCIYEYHKKDTPVLDFDAQFECRKRPKQSIFPECPPLYNLEGNGPEIFQYYKTHWL